MKRLITWLGAVMTAVFLFSTVVARAGQSEEELALDEVPKPIMAAVKARFENAEATEAAKETKGDEVVYEISISPKGQNIDITLTEQADIILIEKTLVAEDLPQAVKEVLEHRYPKATYKTIEEVINVKNKEEKLGYYEVTLMTADEQDLEVEVTPDGRITKESKKQLN